MSDSDDSKKTKDTRPVCKYGVRCYQKNPLHHQKYRHPPKRVANNKRDNPPAKRTKTDTSNSDDDSTKHVAAKRQSPDLFNDSDSETESRMKAVVLNSDSPKKKKETVSDSDSETESRMKAVVLNSNSPKKKKETVSDSDSETESKAPEKGVKKKECVSDDETETEVKTSKKKELLSDSSDEESNDAKDIINPSDDVNNPSDDTKNPNDDAKNPNDGSKNPNDTKNPSMNNKNASSNNKKYFPTDINAKKDSNSFTGKRLSLKINPKDFIKQKFLVEMPQDFYDFWDLCKKLHPQKPEDAFREFGLILVGPYDVLAGKFNETKEQVDDNYLCHWRYYFDPPEMQTVLKGDDTKGYHIGYFRDDPKQAPVFLASNCAKKDAILDIVGANIFATVYLYLQDQKNSSNPFMTMKIPKLLNEIKTKAEELKLPLTKKTDAITSRSYKKVATLFSKIGLVVPYNRKSQVGYRSLVLKDKELIKLLDKIKKALPEQLNNFLSEFQHISTCTSIATDECDFGTGLELGLNIFAHDVPPLDKAAASFLANSYNLLGRAEFAKIAEAHLSNRKRGCRLSILY